MIRRSMFCFCCFLLISTTVTAKGAALPAKVELRAEGVDPGIAGNPAGMTRARIVEAFKRNFPHINPVPTTGLRMIGRDPGFSTLMKIAGDIPPDVMFVNFPQSDTYVRNKFLYPLDKYIECGILHLDIPGSHLLELDRYLGHLRKSPQYDREIKDRVPAQCWPVIRRPCPYGSDCPYLLDWGAESARKHYHVWAFPLRPAVTCLFYRRDLFHEAGLPDAAPDTWEELLQYARKLTNPKEKRYGIELPISGPSWSTVNFLYSMGGKLVQRDEKGRWKCVFDSKEAVEAFYFVARLYLEPFENQHGKFTSVVYPSPDEARGDILLGMKFHYISLQRFSEWDPANWGFGPVPKGPTGIRGSGFNASMFGIYAGLEDNDELCDAAWEYIRFYDGPQARRIRAEVFVENGMGRFIQPQLLEQAGFPEYVRQVPGKWTTAYGEALRNGIPEPYGKNCQMVYRYAAKTVEQIRASENVRQAIMAGDAEKAKAVIAAILKERVQFSNEKMLNIIPAGRRKSRATVASCVAVGVLLMFVLVFRKVFRIFSATQIAEEGRMRRSGQFARYKWAYILLVPAVGSIALWMYYPLARGSVMAFQDYNVRGFSEWVGISNFANVLYDEEFRHAMWVSLKYAVMFGLFGFTAPIVLAFLLNEVPRGKLIFRTIYYLPAVLAGVIVIFLWRGFYEQYGVLNGILNFFIDLLNRIPGVALQEIHKAWLEDPDLALFFVLLPVIWVGFGPGCLIYLAALRTIPEELYEAADIDGAGVLGKTFHVAVPGIRALIMINFIGVMVAQIKGGSQFVLAMTGGGPYTPYGATEMVGLHIYWQAFGYLRFGHATAMAWVLGSMLVGFTVIQLQRISRVEFRTAGGVA